MSLISGTSASERLTGTPGIDTILGLLGDDTLKGLGSDDLIAGDRLLAPPSIGRLTDRDVLFGNDGNDTLYGGADSDRLHGGNGNDWLYGEYIAGHNGLFGDDSLYGEGGNDYLDGDSGNDFLNGGLGDDTIFGGGGHDQILGSHGNDSIFGDVGNDTIDGGSGNDTIYGGGGYDSVVDMSGNNYIVDVERVETGDGDDFIKISSTPSAFVRSGQGNDEAVIRATTADVATGSGDDTIDGSSSEASQIRGQNGDDFIDWYGQLAVVHGGRGDDDIRGIGELHGDEGNDELHKTSSSNFLTTLVGGAGDDTLGSYSGSSVMIGGSGADTFWANKAMRNSERVNIAKDFEDGLDIVIINRGRDFDSFDDLDFIQSGDDVLVGFTNRNDTVFFLILLEDFDASQLDPSDFFIFG